MRLQSGAFFGVSSEPVTAGAFSIACLRPTVPMREMEIHTHEAAHFVLVLSGSYESSARGGDAITSGPTLIYNPPGTRHRDCFLDLDGSFLTISIAKQYCKAPDYAVRLTGLRPAMTIFREFASPRRSALHLESLAVELLDTAGKEPAASRQAPGWLARAIELIEDRWQEALGLDQIAAALAIHPVHLTRAFRKYMHETPGSYHKRCRAARAASLLSRHERSLADVGLELGFADQSHFSRSFRQSYGLAPGEFRNAVGLFCPRPDSKVPPSLSA